MNKHITHTITYITKDLRAEILGAFLEITKLSCNQIGYNFREPKNIIPVFLACSRARVDLSFYYTYTRIRQEYSNPDLSSEAASKVKFLKYDY